MKQAYVPATADLAADLMAAEDALGQSLSCAEHVLELRNGILFRVWTA